MATEPMGDRHCATCNDSGHVCEDHPDRAWGGLCCDGPRFLMIEGIGVIDTCEHG